MKFSELGITPELEQALEKEGITTPTPIQEKAAPAIFDGKDVYISSETGSGKTLAYLLPLLSKIDFSTKDLKVIVLTPTHELASQIQDQLVRLKQNSGLELRSQLLIGSASTKRQLEKLKKKPHIVVGSAGRILEFIKMKKLKVHKVTSVVIDEADNMLFGDKIDVIHNILGTLQKERQIVFASATNQPEANQNIKSIAKDIVLVHTNSNTICDTIEHIYFSAHENEKQKLLGRIIKATKTERAIVFTHKNETAKRTARNLGEIGITVGEIHGDCDKLQRVKAIEQFKRGKIRVLVASDMAARGLDVKGVTHIFNVDIPGKSKDYLHRAGRTGRAGAHGYCISLMSGEEKKIMRRYERELQIKITRAKVSEGIIVLYEGSE